MRANRDVPASTRPAASFSLLHFQLPLRPSTQNSWPQPVSLNYEFSLQNIRFENNCKCIAPEWEMFIVTKLFFSQDKKCWKNIFGLEKLRFENNQYVPQELNASHKLCLYKFQKALSSKTTRLAETSQICSVILKNWYTYEFNKQKRKKYVKNKIILGYLWWFQFEARTSVPLSNCDTPCQRRATVSNGLVVFCQELQNICY